MSEEENKVGETETPEVIAKSSAPSQEKPKRDEKDTAAYNLRRNAERARELGLDPGEILGVKTHIETDSNDEDSKPVTVGMLRDIQKQDAHKTALQRAEEIVDEETRAAVKDILTTRVKPSGDSEEDFRFALSAANAGKNTQIIKEVQRYVVPKRTAAGGSMPAHIEEEFTPTAEENRFMQPPYNISKEKIIAARRQAADKNR